MSATSIKNPQGGEKTGLSDTVQKILGIGKYAQRPKSEPDQRLLGIEKRPEGYVHDPEIAALAEREAQELQQRRRAGVRSQ